MPEFVPSGYISIREALNRLGLELFPSDWTGQEHKARGGLISVDEWLKIKDLVPARGGDATGGTTLRRTLARPVTAPRLTSAPGKSLRTATVPSTDDPSSSAYQQEYRANKRYADARDRLRALLESGDLEAAILDPWTGTLHRAPASLWRRFGAARIIEKGEAPLPRSRNTGRLFVKRFAEASVHIKSMPQAKIREAIEALKEKIATESLTRPQQAEFVRNIFPSYHVTGRQLGEIFRGVPVRTGRPRKSDKKV